MTFVNRDPYYECTSAYDQHEDDVSYRGNSIRPLNSNSKDSNSNRCLGEYLWHDQHGSCNECVVQSMSIHFQPKVTNMSPTSIFDNHDDKASTSEILLYWSVYGRSGVATGRAHTATMAMTISRSSHPRAPLIKRLTYIRKAINTVERILKHTVIAITFGPSSSDGFDGNAGILEVDMIDVQIDDVDLVSRAEKLVC